MASQMQNALLLSGAATRASVEEWSKLHTSVMYSGIKKMPLELMLSSIDHIPKLYIHTLWDFCVNPSSSLGIDSWLGVFSTEEALAATLRSLAARATDHRVCSLG